MKTTTKLVEVYTKYCMGTYSKNVPIVLPKFRFNPVPFIFLCKSGHINQGSLTTYNKTHNMSKTET